MLLKEGASFTDAYQDHAVTETARGIRRFCQGAGPRTPGIIRNRRGCARIRRALIGVNGRVSSPRGFAGARSFDWLKAETRGARALSISGKGPRREFCQSAGRKSGYWYYGGYSRRSILRDSLPTWVRAFNGQRVPFPCGGDQWTLFLPERTTRA